MTAKVVRGIEIDDDEKRRIITQYPSYRPFIHYNTIVFGICVASAEDNNATPFDIVDVDDFVKALLGRINIECPLNWYVVCEAN